MNQSITDAFVNGFIKAANLTNPFSLSFHPDKLSIKYDYQDPTLPPKFDTRANYSNSPSVNAAPTSLSAPTSAPPAKAQLDLTPGQLKNYIAFGKTQTPQMLAGYIGYDNSRKLLDYLNADKTTLNAVSGWEKYHDFEKAPGYARLAGWEPRPILNNAEQSATRQFTDNYSTADLAKRMLYNPEDTKQVMATMATTPSTAGIATGTAGLLSKIKSLGTLGKGLGAVAKATPGLDAVSLISGLANEANTVPQQVVEAGGVQNFLNNNSRVQSNWTTVPGYLANVYDNLAKPATSYATAVNDVKDIAKTVSSSVYGRLGTFLASKVL